MEKKRKILFSAPGERRQEDSEIHSEPERLTSGSLESNDTVKKELALVAAIILVIGLSFSAIFFTDKNSNWIESKSQSIVKFFVKSY